MNTLQFGYLIPDSSYNKIKNAKFLLLFKNFN